jgi:SulP family sulfate permease
MKAGRALPVNGSVAEAGRGLRFDRLELAGSFGDLGTFLPIVVAMILINGLSPSAVLLAFGLFYIFTGLFYGLPVPVQPLKAVAAIAIASPALITVPVLAAAGILFGAVMFVLWAGRLVDLAARLFTAPVVRGIQFSLGLIFLRKGFELIVSGRMFVDGRVGPFAAWHANLWLGILVFALVLLLLDNRRFPAAIVALTVGIAVGVLGGGLGDSQLAFGPTELRLVVPKAADFWTAAVLLVLPQIPLTIGNSCFGTAATAASLFPDDQRLERAQASSFAFTMGLANIPAGLLGAIPMCHGTGGLVAHHRFGARTGGAPVIIGLILVALALVFGRFGFALLASIPNAVLGVLLVFAGLELCPLVRNLKTNEEYFVALVIAGIALAVPNMAWAFGAGIVVDQIIRRARVTV